MSYTPKGAEQIDYYKAQELLDARLAADLKINPSLGKHDEIHYLDFEDGRYHCFIVVYPDGMEDAWEVDVSPDPGDDQVYQV